jgi:ribosomal protein L37E
MEKRFQSLSLFEFQQRFPDDQTCMEYLGEIKWPDGFICEKCGHQKYCNGKLIQTRQCTSCGYQATPTSGTLFHKVKFPLLKAFYIIYFMSTNKKGITSTELSRKLNLRQKTCWSFRKKVTQAMKSSKQYPLEGIVEIDEMVIGQQEEAVKGRENDKKKLVIIAIEKKGKGISRMYARVVKKASKKDFKPFFEDHISKKAEIRTDGWSTYKSFKKDYPNLKQEKSGKKGENFNDMHRVIMMFKGWMRGIHHSVDHLQDYLDEYSYRFNRSYMGGAIFDNLLTRAVRHQPVSLKINDHRLSA